MIGSAGSVTVRLTKTTSSRLAGSFVSSTISQKCSPTSSRVASATSGRVTVSPERSNGSTMDVLTWSVRTSLAAVPGVSHLQETCWLPEAASSMSRNTYASLPAEAPGARDVPRLPVW